MSSGFITLGTTSCYWIRTGINADPEERPLTDKEKKASGLPILTTDWSNVMMRRFRICVSGKMEVSTNSCRNDAIQAYLDAGTQSDPPTLAIPYTGVGPGPSGAITSVVGKWVCNGINIQDTGQGGKSVVTGSWSSYGKWVLVNFH